MDYFIKACAEPGWEERKKAAGVAMFDDIKAFGDWSDFQDEFSQVMVKAFFPEMEKLLVKWASGDDEHLRANSFRALRHAGKLDLIDVWVFHEKTLVNYYTVYIPLHMQDAVKFFKGHAAGPDSAHAKAALEAGRKYVTDAIAKFTKDKMPGNAESSQRGLEMIEDALKAFGGE